MYRLYCQKTDSASSIGANCDPMDLSNVIKKLNKMAHPSLAGSWDNVGLLVEPSPPHIVNMILLTNDLTPPVVEEAILRKADLIVSYHPPIFSALKKLTQRQWKEKIVIQCLEKKMAVFSPHTTYDCLLGGVNDWLIGCFECKDIQPVEQHTEMLNNSTHVVEFDTQSEISSRLHAKFKTIQDSSVAQCLQGADGLVHMKVMCSKAALTQIMARLKDFDMANISNLQFMQLSEVPKVGYGMGRKSKLKSSVSLDDAVNTVKKHLKLDHVRLAVSPETKAVSSVAVCAGSGSSVLHNVPADLYVTGEMSHHEVLHAMYSGTSVILCDHSNTERGYLVALREKYREMFEGKIQVEVSETDADPLKIV
ncbi:NIF3-like protein 1 isoform X2 [Dreissena polymorpha]|uniref:NIF3-like protein 1 n=2 Tax=Dreissena polymorpha TaxID=45954 RepID=A0A9D4N9D8_DREPO|nr:NIF3-like protein 1 isoform X2 [Dreissena polymorpha]KAH3889629.1 hypothetical protein DPMN_013688 [Dreissena polymorpha]